MQVKHGLNNLADDEGRNVLTESFTLSDECKQIFAVYILGNDVDVGFTADGLLILHNLWMRNHFHYLTLIVEHSYGFFGKFFSAHVLEGV